MQLDAKDLSRLDVDGRAAVRRTRIGLVFQFGELVAELSLLDNVALAAELAGATRRQSLVSAMAILEDVGLADQAHRRPGDVSGGQAQRAAVARALVHGPRLILADEPTGALDSENAERALDLLLDLCGRSGSAVLLATHDRAVAERCDRVASLLDGRLASSHERPV